MLGFKLLELIFGTFFCFSIYSFYWSSVHQPQFQWTAIIKINETYLKRIGTEAVVDKASEEDLDPGSLASRLLFAAFSGIIGILLYLTTTKHWGTLTRAVEDTQWYVQKSCCPSSCLIGPAFLVRKLQSCQPSKYCPSPITLFYIAREMAIKSFVRVPSFGLSHLLFYCFCWVLTCAFFWWSTLRDKNRLII